MSTYVQMRANVARRLQDPTNKTFTNTICADIVQSAMAEMGRVTPQRFKADITPVANQLVYGVQAPGVTSVLPEVEVTRVELWDGSTTPATPLTSIQPMDGEQQWSNNGWKVWDGKLYLPRWVPTSIAGNESRYLFKVWGYSPYEPLSADADVCPLSQEREMALYDYARVEGLRMLAASRELFTQWQTRSGNTDTTFAGILNALNIAEDSWRRKRLQIMVLRESPS